MPFLVAGGFVQNSKAKQHRGEINCLLYPAQRMGNRIDAPSSVHKPPLIFRRGRARSA
jgi:hypothetical protein